MKKQLIFSFLILSFIFVITRGQIENCDSNIHVRSFDSSQQYLEICSKCAKDFILNDNYSECSQGAYYEPLKDCAQSNSRLTCLQGQGCLVLNENSIFVNIQDDRCAIISQDLSTCLMPKFGYTYVLPDKTYTPVDRRMCAVFNSVDNKCEKYYYRFLPVLGQDYSVFFQNFINFDQILKGSHSQSINCKAPYILSPQSSKNFGCILQQTPNNCKQQNEVNECEICNENFAINSQNGLCEPFPYTFKGCLIQKIDGIFNSCIKCSEGFILESGKCKEIAKCATFSKQIPFLCEGCTSPYYGDQCTSIQNIAECEIQNKGNCLKCYNNDLYYVNDDKCVLRSKSTQCLEKNPVGDYCNSWTDQNNQYFDLISVFGKETTIIYLKSYEKELLQTVSNKTVFDRNQQYFKNIGIFNSFTYIQLAKPTLIDGCEQYSLIANVCIKCVQGKNLYINSNNIVSQCLTEVPPSVDGCDIADSNGQGRCFQCKELYYITNSGLCVEDTEKNCLAGIMDEQQKKKCYVCAKGYVLNKNDQTCRKYEDCSSQEVSGYENCKYCLAGPQFYFTAQVNTGIYTKCKPLNNLCKIEADGVCYECYPGYTYNSTTKTCFTSDKLINCKKSINSTTCTLCNKSYTLKNGLCQADCMNSCSSFDCPVPICFQDGQLKCAQCKGGEINSGSMCQFQCMDGILVTNESQCTQKPNCNSTCQTCRFIDPNQCITCFFGSKLKDGKCEQICPVGKFFESKYVGTEIIESCEDCPAECSECTSSFSCTLCKAASQNLENGKCQCPQGQYFSISKLSCEKCLPYCKTCTSGDKCESCTDFNMFMKNGQCTCPIGSYIEESTKMCTKCSSTCSACTSYDECITCADKQAIHFQKKCYSCNFNEFFSEDKLSCIPCSPLCSQCNSTDTCNQCTDLAIFNNGKCECSIGTFASESKYCKSCPSLCDKCTNEKKCDKCQDLTVLINGLCYESCPSGTYFSDKKLQCELCQPQCLSCNAEDKCSVCAVSSTTLDNNCKCPTGSLYFQKQCISTCPQGWSQDIKGENCKRDCKNNEYLLYNDTTQQFECSVITSDSSSYCSKLIEQIPKLIELRVKKFLDKDYEITLNIQLSETPSACFTYKVIGQPKYELSYANTESIYPNSLSFDVKIPKSDIPNPDKLVQGDKQSFLYFQIYYKDYLQYSAKVTLTHNYILVLSSNIEYTGEYGVIDTVCKECEVPVEKQIPSTTSVSCPVDSQCDQTKITTYTNAIITITQLSNDPSFKNSSIKPHSIFIKVPSTPGKYTIFSIQNYTFDNSKLGQITYKFAATGSIKGTLVVTSKASTGTGRFLLASTPSSTYKYHTGNFQLDIQEKIINNNVINNNNTDNKGDDNDSSQKTILIASICSAISAFVIAGIIFYCYRKRQQNKLKTSVVPSFQNINHQVVNLDNNINNDNNNNNNDLSILQKSQA